MKLRSRIVLSVLVALVYLAANGIYGSFKASVEATAAVQQVEDSVPAYVFGQQMARGTLVPSVLSLLFLAVLLILLWWKPVVRALRGKTSGNGTAVFGVIAVLTAGLSLAGCGPAHVQKFETIGPNETAFVIPLQGATSTQAKFQSVKYLQDHQIPLKQIEIPTVQHDLGRGPGDYEWMPTVRVIKVNRAPVTREWTKGATGTSPENQAIAVESLESINFRVGINATANILEEDAATYLYWFGEIPLSQVMDQNVRGYLQSGLSLTFGKTSLEDCKKQKGNFVTEAAKSTTEHFKKLGVNIMSMGGSEGLLYDDATIQDAINKTATSEMNIEISRKNKLAQDEVNKQAVATAVAQRQAAEEFAKAAQAQRERIGLDIQMKYADAALVAAQNLKDLKGNLPSFLPADSRFLFGLAPPPQPSK
jgi:hypothetical protein